MLLLDDGTRAEVTDIRYGFSWFPGPISHSGMTTLAAGQGWQSGK